MSLEIVTHQVEGIEIAVLQGQLTFGPGVLALRNAVERLVARDVTKSAIDLTGVTEIDTTGIGTLEFAADLMRGAGGGLAVFNKNPEHIDVLIEAELSTVLRVLSSEQEAVNSFFPDRAVNHYDILEFTEAMALKDDPASGTDALSANPQTAVAREGKSNVGY